MASVLLLLIDATLAAAAPSALPETIVYDPTVAAIIAQVTTPTLSHELAGLTGERLVSVGGISYTIATRNSFQATPIARATRYAREQLARTGLDVTYHHYDYSTHSLRNVVAEKPGLVDPDQIYMITAHIDDMPEGTLAPGADDNGSGSVAVLMAARLLAPYSFSYTIRFVLFTGEEQGLRGSDAYADDCYAAGDDIRGVVNLDMIAYNSTAKPAPIIDLCAYEGVPDSLVLTRIFSDVIGVYDLDLIPERKTDDPFPIRYSDQWRFLENGDPAILAIEDWDDHTPHYHRTTDRLVTLDLDYYAASTQASIATIAHLAGLLPHGTLAGIVTAQEDGQPLADITVYALTPEYAHTFTTRSAGGGAYALPLPADGVSVTTWAASPGYYAATPTDVWLTAGSVVTQDYALAHWPRFYLPLIVHDP